MRVVAGPEKKTRVMGEKERLITAYHEMGHAIVGHYLEHSDPVHKISIISRGQALGYTISLPTEDKFLTTRAELTDTMAMTLGGRAAEEIVFGEITTGASNDLEKVTATAKQMVMRFGMSEKLGPRVFGHDHGQPFLGREFSAEPDYSDEIAREIDDEIRRIVEGAHQQAKDILAEHREALDDDLRAAAQARDDRARGVRGAAGRQGPGGGLRPRRRSQRRHAGAPGAAPGRRSRRPRRPAPAAAPRPRRRHDRGARPLAAREARPGLSARKGSDPFLARGGVVRTVGRGSRTAIAGLHERGARRGGRVRCRERHAPPPPHPTRERRRAAAVGRPPPPTVQLEEAQHLMRSFEYIVPVDTRSAQRLPEAHTYSTPVVRELPRPIPQGLGGTAW